MPPSPSTPAGSREPAKCDALAAVRGSLMHLSQEADGKLRWLPPSSSSTSSSQSSLRTGSGIKGAVSRPFCAEISSSIMINSLYNQEEHESSSMDKSFRTSGADPCVSSQGPASPEIMPPCRNRTDSDSSSAIYSAVEAIEDNLSGHEALCMPSTDSFSVSYQQGISATATEIQSQSKLLSLVRSAPAQGLSPYLSSKLKPGRHVLGQRKHRVYIRPGQLRHWAAVASSPALASNLGSLSSNGKKACRSLLFH